MNKVGWGASKTGFLSLKNTPGRAKPFSELWIDGVWLQDNSNQLVTIKIYMKTLHYTPQTYMQFKKGERLSNAEDSQVEIKKIIRFLKWWWINKFTNLEPLCLKTYYYVEFLFSAAKSILIDIIYLSPHIHLFIFLSIFHLSIYLCIHPTIFNLSLQLDFIFLVNI